MPTTKTLAQRFKDHRVPKLRNGAHVFQAVNNEWYYHVVRGGNILHVSEGYTREQDARRALRAMKEFVRTLLVYDVKRADGTVHRFHF